MAQPTSYRARTTEVRGFVGWVSSFVVFGSIIVWASAPQSLLNALGLAPILPHRHWALAIPCFVVAGIIFHLWLSTAKFLIWAEPTNSAYLLHDQPEVLGQVDHTKTPTILSGPHAPPVQDMDIFAVNRLLYLSSSPKRSTRLS